MRERPPARFHRLLAAGVTLAASAAIVLGTAHPAAAVIVSPGYDSLVISATPAEASVGDTITVTAVATGLVDAYAYDLDIAYDPEVVEFVVGSESLPAGGFGTADAADGIVSVVAARLGTSPGLTGTQTLVTVSFTAIAAGDTTISLTGGRFVDSAGTTAVVDTESPTLASPVTVAADETPGTGTPGTPGTPGNGAGSGAGAGNASTGTDADALANTGADAAPWFLLGGLALALIIGGTVLVRRGSMR